MGEVENDDGVRDRSGRELRYLLLLVAAAFAVYALTQHRITLDGGHPYDAGEYRKVAEQLADGMRPSGPAPFVYRLGLPALGAALAPDHLDGFFRLVDMCAGLAAGVLLWAWLRRYVPHPQLRLALVAAFLVQSVGPMRFGLSYPGLTYGTFWCLLVGALLLLDRCRERSDVISLVLLAAIVAAGAFVRETMLLLVPVALFAPGDRGPRVTPVPAAVVAVTGGAVVAITHLVVTTTGSYTFASEAWGSLGDLTVPGLTMAWFTAFGAVLAVILIRPRPAARFLRAQPHLAALLAVVTLLSLAGGVNTELFLLWATPAVLAVGGAVVSQERESFGWWPVAALLVAVHLLIARVLWPIPDIPGGRDSVAVFAPWGPDARWFDLFSKLADRGLVTAIAIEDVLFVGLLFALWTYHRARATERG